MVDVLSKSQRSYCMSRIRGKDTSPELMLRHAIWALGLRYRLNRRIGRRRVDLVFPGARVAVFVDGCFWHQCPLHGVMPKANRAFWKKKLDQNVKRDIATSEELKREGWFVIRFWEHEIDASVESCAQKVHRVVLTRRGRSDGKVA